MLDLHAASLLLLQQNPSVPRGQEHLAGLSFPPSFSILQPLLHPPTHQPPAFTIKLAPATLPRHAQWFPLRFSTTLWLALAQEHVSD